MRKRNRLGVLLLTSLYRLGVVLKASIREKKEPMNNVITHKFIGSASKRPAL